jgi:predicted kinase
MTTARRLEHEHAALRLTLDEWLQELYPEHWQRAVHPQARGDELEHLRAPLELVQWRTALRVLQLGCNVVLDWGLWGREERDRYRMQARAVSARVVLVLLDPPLEELWQRLSARNATPDRLAPSMPHGRGSSSRWLSSSGLDE